MRHAVSLEARRQRSWARAMAVLRGVVPHSCRRHVRVGDASVRVGAVSVGHSIAAHGRAHAVRGGTAAVVVLHDVRRGRASAVVLGAAEPGATVSRAPVMVLGRASSPHGRALEARSAAPATVVHHVPAAIVVTAPLAAGSTAWGSSVAVTTSTAAAAASEVLAAMGVLTRGCERAFGRTRRVMALPKGSYGNVHGAVVQLHNACLDEGVLQGLSVPELHKAALGGLAGLALLRRGPEPSHFAVIKRVLDDDQAALGEGSCQYDSKWWIIWEISCQTWCCPFVVLVFRVHVRPG
mmetsp:Transcript_11431/g.21778  ORF Transcript_11431/g.21778 Transcript_11431/m.21778 type:complete len:294 (-) Transcript_11431:285-1166(-)